MTNHTLFRTICILLSFTLTSLTLLSGAEYSIQQIADETLINRNPSIGDSGLVAWQAATRSSTPKNSSIHIYYNNERKSISGGLDFNLSASVSPKVSGETVVWQTTYPGIELNDLSWDLVPVPEASNPIENPPPNLQVITNHFQPKKQPGGDNEIALWKATSPEVVRLTRDYRNDHGPMVSGDLMVWQKAKHWPFGWEIMISDGDMFRNQLTTNFYYDMSPQIDGDLVTWYGWDGNDFEIFLYDHSQKKTTQVTSNQFNDVSPMVQGGMLAWEAYPSVEADIFFYKANGDRKVEKLSTNIEDDINPTTWNGQVVWQGFDGDDFEIFFFDGRNTIKLTSNLYDDVNPKIQDGTIVWMGYHENWDSEVFAWDTETVSMLSTNNIDDRAPQTSKGKVVWYADDNEKSYIYLATPKSSGE